MDFNLVRLRVSRMRAQVPMELSAEALGSAAPSIRPTSIALQELPFTSKARLEAYEEAKAVRPSERENTGASF